MKRTIALFSGSRAELGLQLPVLRAIANHPDLEPLMLLGGTHTQEPAHPDDIADVMSTSTVSHVYELPNEGQAGTPQAIATGILSTSEVLLEHKPDALVVYGDRFESYAALIAASQMHIPVAHIEGGDYTAGGCLDDAVRHAMTKLAHLHFTTNEQASERIRRMGEEPWRVHCVGLPSLDFAAAGDYPDAPSLANELGLSLDRPVALFCMHPVPGSDPFDQLLPSTTALAALLSHGCQVVALAPNNDAGGAQMREALELFVREFPAVKLYESLGRRRFHGMLHMMGCRSGFTRGVLIGNSSAGIKEAPWFGCPVVNIGDRQRGRLRGDNVCDVPNDSGEIFGEAKAALSGRRLGANAWLYGSGNAGKQIADVLATVPLDATLMQKRMTY